MLMRRTLAQNVSDAGSKKVPVNNLLKKCVMGRAGFKYQQPVLNAELGLGIPRQIRPGSGSAFLGCSGKVGTDCGVGDTSLDT